uniref:formate dehydrogenase N subunit beta transmembrane domain-containing protein n=1 Tax=Roseomonas chloroacetimidivorans TaxID=1766656 RepID=UPI003C725151
NDKPHIYAGLPDQPRISPLVQTWKGVTKYVGLAAMGFLAAGSLIHGVFARPNRVSHEDEENAEKLVEGKPVPPPKPATQEPA